MRRLITILVSVHARLLFSLVIMLLLSLPDIAQVPAATHFDNLGIAEGLSQSTVHSIIQDHLGYMWICTEDGINQYDGYRFRIFRHEPDNNKSIANSMALAAYEDHFNNLWFVSINGISRYNRATNDFTRVFFQPGQIKGNLRITPVECGDETLFQDDGVLYRINGRTLKVQQQRLSSNGNVFSLLCVTPDSNLLLRDGTSLYKYNLKNGNSIPLMSPAINITDLSGAILLPHNRIIYYGGSRLFICTPTSGTIEKQVDFKDLRIHSSAVFDPQGYLWLAASSGLVCLDTATMQYRVFTTRPGDSYSLAGNTIRCLYRDRTGIVWIGTNDGGVSKMTMNKAKFFGMSYQHDGLQGLFAKAILNFAEDNSGKIWMATDASSINIYDPQTQSITRCDKTTGCNFRTDSYIITLLMNDSAVWCGHENGVDIVSVKTRRIISSPLVADGVAIKKIYKDKEGNIWAGGRAGLFLYNPKLRSFGTFQLSQPIKYVQNIIEDDSHNIWIGLMPGLIKFNPANGMLTNYALKYPNLIAGNAISAFSRDEKGDIWMGSNERGLIGYNQATDSFRYWNTAKGLSNNEVYATVSDNSGKVWVSNNFGVSRFDPEKQTFTNFTVKDGLQSNEFNGGAILKDHTGRLYFGNVAGFNSIDPEHININTTPPKPQITAFRIFDKEISFLQKWLDGGGITLKQSENYFTIEYSAQDYTNPSENKYRIMLKGFDKGWRPISTAHSVSYTNLDAGHYTFRVMAYNNDNVAAQEVLELPIYIMPPFYKTWWFLTLIVIFIIGLAIFAVRIRVRNINRKNAARLQISDLDRQMTEYKLQALQAQMNPHFIFNSLNAIQSIIMQNDALKAATYLADFSKLMRRILDNSHEQFVTLETMVETLQMYVHLEAFRFNNEFTYEFRIEDDLPMKELKLPPMLLQPYVENAILHGLMPKEGGKKLLISLFEKDNKLHCIVEDNGIGRGGDRPEKSHISRGEMLTKGIQDSFNHLLNTNATIAYTDLKDATGKACGTRVEIIIPLH